jgi:hypothetical protein
MLVQFGPPLLFCQAKSQARACNYRGDRIAAWSAARVASAPDLTRSLNEAGTLKLETFAHACAPARTSNPVGLDRKTVRFAIEYHSITLLGESQLAFRDLERSFPDPSLVGAGLAIQALR